MKLTPVEEEKGGKIGLAKFLSFLLQKKVPFLSRRRCIPVLLAPVFDKVAKCCLALWFNCCSVLSIPEIITLFSLIRLPINISEFKTNLIKKSLCICIHKILFLSGKFSFQVFLVISHNRVSNKWFLLFNEWYHYLLELRWMAIVAAVLKKKKPIKMSN